MLIHFLNSKTKIAFVHIILIVYLRISRDCTKYNNIYDPYLLLSVYLLMIITMI